LTRSTRRSPLNCMARRTRIRLPMFFVLLCGLLLQDTDELIRQLGHDDAAVRDKATAALKEAGDKAIPAVRKASESTNPEVAARARAILSVIDVPAHVRAERKATEEARKRLDAQRFTWSLEVVWVDSMMDVTCGQSKVGLYLPDVAKTWASLTVENATAAEIIDKVAASANLKAHVIHGVVIVADPKWNPSELPGRAIDALDSLKTNGAAVKNLEQLCNHEVTYSFSKASVRSVLEIVSKECGANIEVDAAVKGTVSFDCHDVPPLLLVRLICAQVGADLRINEDGALIVEPRK